MRNGSILTVVVDPAGITTGAGVEVALTHAAAGGVDVTFWK